MNNLKTIKVAIADNHSLITIGFSKIISSYSNLEIAFLVPDGKDVLPAIALNKPDVILMDVRMPHMDGIEATKLVKQNYPKIKVIALSMEEHIDTVNSMLQAGVNGYLCKDCEPKEIILAINEVFNKGFYFNKIVTPSLLKTLGIKHGTKIVSRELVELTEREKEVLILMCQEKKNKAIAEELNIGEKTVEKHREHLHRKTKTHSSVGLVIFAIKNRILEI